MKTTFIVVLLLLAPVPLFSAESSPSGYVKQGNEQLKSGKYKAAIRAFEAATRIDPACAEAYEGMGYAYLELGANGVVYNQELLQKAVGNLGTALKLKPDRAMAHYRIAVGYLALNDKDMASREYESLKTLDKGLADKLAVQIGTYAPPKKYRSTGSSGPDIPSHREARKTDAKQPGLDKKKVERFTGTVEVFITKWCPYCKKAVAYLQEKGIPYTAYDIEADAQAKKRYDQLGGRGVPLFLAGGNKFYGSDPRSIDSNLGR